MAARALVHRRRTLRASHRPAQQHGHGARDLSWIDVAGGKHPSNPSATADPADPDRSAALYEQELKSFYGADAHSMGAHSLFDVVLMGAGPDGHTASLFPDFAALEETARWVVGVPRANVAPFVPRVWLTLPALASCREMLFEVAGATSTDLDAAVAGEPCPAMRAIHRRDRLAGG